MGCVIGGKFASVYNADDLIILSSSETKRLLPYCVNGGLLYDMIFKLKLLPYCVNGGLMYDVIFKTGKSH